jgi:hypothetical protein
MCEHGTETPVTVKIPADLSCDGQERLKEVGVDSCIASIVSALQAGGVDMRGSCCGHGKGTGHIDLQDGRGLLILSPDENSRYMVHNGEPEAVVVGTKLRFSVELLKAIDKLPGRSSHVVRVSAIDREPDGCMRVIVEADPKEVAR